jgi:hypothetical protein
VTLRGESRRGGAEEREKKERESRRAGEPEKMRGRAGEREKVGAFIEAQSLPQLFQI